MIIQISAGQGPSECQLAVAKLFAALKKEYDDLDVISETKGYEKGCLDSVRFRTKHDLSGLEGTVLWVCRSPFRRSHKRKNWCGRERRSGQGGDGIEGGVPHGKVSLRRKRGTERE